MHIYEISGTWKGCDITIQNLHAETAIQAAAEATKSMPKNFRIKSIKPIDKNNRI